MHSGMLEMMLSMVLPDDDMMRCVSWDEHGEGAEPGGDQ